MSTYRQLMLIYWRLSAVIECFIILVSVLAEPCIYRILFWIKRRMNDCIWRKKKGIWDTKAAEVFRSYAFNCQSISIKPKIVDIAWVDAYSSAPQFIFFIRLFIPLIDHILVLFEGVFTKKNHAFSPSVFFYQWTRKLKNSLRWK